MNSLKEKEDRSLPLAPNEKTKRSPLVQVEKQIKATPKCETKIIL